MSISKWRWTPDCDGYPYCGDCDECDKEDDMTDQEELAIEVLQEQMERARFETIELGNKEDNDGRT